MPRSTGRHYPTEVSEETNILAKSTKTSRRNSSRPELKDPGFGTRVAERGLCRLLNRDGSFNVRKTGLGFWESLHPYNTLLTMPWWRFYLVVLGSLMLVNMLFGLVYLSFGPRAISGMSMHGFWPRFWDAFFFSVQTFTSVGYGHLAPQGFGPNMIATFNAFVGLMAFALSTGLLFARFARPTAKIVFSDVAIVAPYRETSGLEFRCANARRTQLVDIEVRLLFTEVRGTGASRKRVFAELALERNKVNLLALQWIVVHPIDESSPLWQKSSTDLKESDAEVMVMLTAFDEIFAQTVHARTSYKANEIRWGARFTDILGHSEGRMTIDLSGIDEFEKVELV